MDLKGKKVFHKTFGEGTILEQDASYISVDFIAGETPKKFVYPTCFKTFLTILDSNIAAQAEDAIKQHEEQEKQKKLQAITHHRAKTTQSSFKESKAVKVPSFSSVGVFCDSFKKSIVSEIIVLKNTGGKHQKIFDGILVEKRKAQYIYVFEADDELHYPEGTKINIWEGPLNTPGAIVACEGFQVTISSTKFFGEDISLLEFSAEPWHLLESLNSRLDDISKSPSEIVRALICDGHKAIDFGNTAITTGQETAVRMSTAQPITFVWGPPGTGKTQTLAKIALKHIEQGHRVLMLSYSNVSVDGAIMRVHKLSERKQPGELVRYGYARQADLLTHEYLTSYNLARYKTPQLAREIQELKVESDIAERTLPPQQKKEAKKKIKSQIEAIHKQWKAMESDLVKNARFVATTVSKAIIDKVVRDCTFDVVIFDEASMAYIPQVIYAASLAKKHFVCLGDFRQLPPIVQNDGSSPLNADIFQYCGITSAVDKGRNHKWLCLLDTQYRMHPQISDFAGHWMYGGLLQSAVGMDTKRQSIVNHAPIMDHAMAFADLSGMMSVCSKTGDNSRVNVLSAMISFALALDAASKYEVGIIAPYRSQARLLHAMSRDVLETNPKLKSISCATVHQFQGSEKDVIIYDAVDCYRMPYPGSLLTTSANNQANRLFNVALTRAKGKFVGVANIAYMDNKSLSPNLMFTHMINSQRKKASCINGESLAQKRSAIGGTSMSFFDYSDGCHQFLKDIDMAKREIRIDIPNRPVADTYSTQLATRLKDAKRKGVKVYLRAENKQTLPPALKPFAAENHFVFNPVTVIDKKLVWFGMPGSEANFETEGKVLQTKYRPIIRFLGTHTAKTLYGFLEMAKTDDDSIGPDKDEDGNAITETLAGYILANKKCPTCGKPMRLKKSKKGSFFMGCTGYPGCHEMAFIDAHMVEKYFYHKSKAGKHCAQCGFSLEAKDGKFGTYVQCCGSKHHIYKLNEV